MATVMMDEDETIHACSYRNTQYIYLPVNNFALKQPDVTTLNRLSLNIDRYQLDWRFICFA